MRKYFFMQAFKTIGIAGTPHERGVMHGRILRDEIADVLVFYRDIFKRPEAEVLELAAAFQRTITEFNIDYIDEIQGIAEGSGQDPLWIVALNARTEILAQNKNNFVNECTSLCFPGPSILGQTWDWGKPLEALCVVMHIRRSDGHEICMLTEPGIIGKIGMNNAGLGVCLNILTLGCKLDGVPIHIMLRAILDCQSTREAIDVINKAPFGKSSNILVADRSGQCFDKEFAGDEMLTPEAINGSFIHTNHYLGKEINAASDPLFFNSRSRMKMALERASETTDYSLDTMIDILSDRSDDKYPIYRSYLPDDVLQDVGTVATILMDLSAQQFHIRKGNQPDSPFTTFTVK
jgi:isopenicillin-N N-acyltransferase-like protein